MKVKVIYSVWGADGFDQPLGGGVHDLDGVTEEQARSIAGAAAAGVVEVLDASKAEQSLLAGHVQSQEDGEAAYAAAQGEWVDPVYETLEDGSRGPLVEYGYWTGGWQQGSLADFIATREDKLAALLRQSEGITQDEKAAKVEAIEHDLRIARARLAKLLEGAEA